MSTTGHHHFVVCAQEDASGLFMEQGVLKRRDFFLLRTAPRGLFVPAQRGPCLSPLFGDRRESRSYVAIPPSFGRHF